MTKNIKMPNVAGMFYPENSRVLRQKIATYLSEAKSDDTIPKALIAPHAGYVYSGPIAGTAYKTLLPIQKDIKRIVLLGPAHYYPFQSIATLSAKYYSTPLGEVPIDQSTIIQWVEEGLVEVINDAFDREHSLEVHIPFLQYVLSDFSLVPLVVGHAEIERVKAVIEAAWALPDTFVIVSSDLSHYHEYFDAKTRDQKTAEAIIAGDVEAIGSYDACGQVPVRGLMLAAKARGLKAKCLDLRNSGDTMGNKDKVVGYGAFEFIE